MNPKTFFLEPTCAAHKQYEALKAFYTEDLSVENAAAKFGFKSAYFQKIRFEFTNKLKEVRRIEWLSYADIIRIGLGIIEPKARTAKEQWDKWYEESFEKGWRNTKLTYTITYSCCV